MKSQCICFGNGKWLCRMSVIYGVRNFNIVCARSLSLSVFSLIPAIIKYPNKLFVRCTPSGTTIRRHIMILSFYYMVYVLNTNRIMGMLPKKKEPLKCFLLVFSVDSTRENQMHKLNTYMVCIAMQTMTFSWNVWIPIVKFQIYTCALYLFIGLCTVRVKGFGSNILYICIVITILRSAK